MARAAGALVLFAALLLLGIAAPAPAAAVAPPPLRAAHGAVASDHPAASAVGAEAMKAGGNAADAACATAIALGVVNPQSSGLGGGGFAVVYVAREKKVYALDFREKAPAALKPESFVRDGKIDPQLSRRGGLAVGVPGEPRGLAELVRRFGKRSFADCVRPSEKLALKVPVTGNVAEAINRMTRGAPAGKPGFIDQVFKLPKPPPVKAGDLLARPALAATLAELRKRGPDAFYTGKIGAEIVKSVGAAGGVLTLEDMAGYNVVERKPLETTYRGLKVYTMPPPSSGGIVVIQTLAILAARAPDPAKLPPRASSAHFHLLAEALKHGFADRARHLGDPDFVEMPLAKLLDPAYHQELAARIKDDAVLPPDKYGFVVPGVKATPPKGGGTAHLSVIDAEGNAVALTTTVNLWFGAQLVAGPTGIVLNDEIDDFSLAPDVPNAFALIGTDKNAVAGGKRPLSSMTPTIVVEGERVKLAVGGAGGPTIISGTLQVLLNVVDGKMDAQEASAAPRIHHQWNPNVLSYESEIPRDVLDGLERRGHKLQARGHITTANVVVRTAEGVEAAAELRASGGPAGY